jgi:hypothetical protein
VSVAQAVKRNAPNASCCNETIKGLSQAVRVPRYPVVTKHKLASADPWVLRTMLFQRLNSQRGQGDSAPTALRLGCLESCLALQPLYGLIDREPRRFQINARKPKRCSIKKCLGSPGSKLGTCIS